MRMLPFFWGGGRGKEFNLRVMAVSSALIVITQLLSSTWASLNTLTGPQHSSGPSPVKTTSMVVLSSPTYTRPGHAEAKSAPPSSSRVPSLGTATSQEDIRPVYVPGDPYPRVYPAGGTQPRILYPRGNTISQVRFKPPLPK